jgi:hypothetical protein
MLSSVAAHDSAHVEIDARQLRLLLDGIDTRKLKFRRHFAGEVRIEDRARRDGSDE